MRTTIATVAVWALAISPLAACSNSDPPPSPTTTTAATTMATDTPSPSVATSYTKTDLDAALLTLADLPAGYKPNTEMGPDYTVMSSCTDEAIVWTATAKTRKPRLGRPSAPARASWSSNP